jgi:hypothetical protein
MTSTYIVILTYGADIYANVFILKATKNYLVWTGAGVGTEESRRAAR